MFVLNQGNTDSSGIGTAPGKEREAMQSIHVHHGTFQIYVLNQGNTDNLPCSSGQVSNLCLKIGKCRPRLVLGLRLVRKISDSAYQSL